MKQTLISNVIQEMLNILDNEQLKTLEMVLSQSLEEFDLKKSGKKVNPTIENKYVIDKFIEAKGIEGCSKKTISYYQSTVTKALAEMGINFSRITTDDLTLDLSKSRTTAADPDSIPVDKAYSTHFFRQNYNKCSST